MRTVHRDFFLSKIESCTSRQKFLWYIAGFDELRSALWTVVRLQVLEHVEIIGVADDLTVLMAPKRKDSRMASDSK